MGTALGDNLLMCEMKWEIVYIATTADVHTFCFMKRDFINIHSSRMLTRIYLIAKDLPANVLLLLYAKTNASFEELKQD